MNTQKIQITLTPQEIAALSLKSKALGYNVTKYVKFLITKEAHATLEHIPVAEVMRIYEEEKKQGKLKKLDNVDNLDAA